MKGGRLKAPVMEQEGDEVMVGSLYRRVAREAS
jgi:hypothetical protein